MTKLTHIDRDLLTEGLDDYVGLWEFVWLLRDRGPTANDAAIRDGVMASVRRLLSGGYIEAGALLENGSFSPWEAPPEEMIERISKEWSRLGREPMIGEIAWFSNTDLGDELARSVSPSS